MDDMPDGPAIGDEVSFSRTITEGDVHAFAELTGDFAAAHMDEAAMRQSVYGRRIAHGAMLVGFMSAASTLLAGRYATPSGPDTLVTLGYDRIRFTAPAFFGDTVTVRYLIVDIQRARRRYLGDVSVSNAEGTLLAVATNILAWTGRAQDLPAPG